MAKIYLVNVGANTSHSGSVRSPIFSDNTFVYVPFPDQPGRPYSQQCLPFVRGHQTAHDDPDWQHLTYGDRLQNAGNMVPRAIALAKIKAGDILLYWSLLWKNNGNGWAGFNGERGWYLIGALRVSEIVTEKVKPDQISPQDYGRAANSIHFGPNGQPPTGDMIFIGDPNNSARFVTAIDLEAGNQGGLLFQAFRSASGEVLYYDQSPRWRSSLRSCRAMFDLEDDQQRIRAELIRQRIQTHNQFDLLAGM